MKSLFNRSALVRNLKKAYADPQALQDQIADDTMPTSLSDWLSSLALLQGVPFNYLVPDEAMLPPESIRFFYLDSNWISALTDGAMSIGRNLSSDTNTSEMNLQKAIQPAVKKQVRRSLTKRRAKAFGLQATEVDSTIISGFLLRSSLVLDYPGIAVDVYPINGTPADPDPQTLTILRWEQLGPTSDTLICLVSGDAYRVDIHEPPQGLHYGIDCFDDGCTVEGQEVTALKNLYTFGISTTTTDGVTTNSVTMSSTVTPTDITNCFRTLSPRVLAMSTLADLILKANESVTPPANTTAPTGIDSAEMGFEMTEGVGLVSFFKSLT